MKRFITILLVLLIGFQTFYPVTIYAFYYGNKNYIAATLCENKNKPQLHCNGKCFIKKQLKKAEQEQQQEKSVLKENALSSVFIVVDSYTHKYSFLEIATNFSSHLPNLYHHLFLPSHFRPPCLS